jgi:transcriptional regulator of acetoin/glycerol metabolism
MADLENGNHRHAGAYARQYQGGRRYPDIDRSTLYEKLKRYQIPR